METLTDQTIEIHPLIEKRWSPRAFSDRPIEAEALLQLFEAARWAASSYNEQPWRFIVATRDDLLHYARLLGCLSEFNQKWADNAPVLMLSIAKTHFDRNDKPNRHAFHDVGLAMGNLITQATSLGIYVHQMAGFDPEKAREMLEIPEGFEPVAMCAIGYPGDPEQLPEKLEKKEHAPQKRIELNKLVYSNRWGQPFASQETIGRS